MIFLSLEQIKEALGDVNRHYTWESLGKPKRDPTPIECIEYYSVHRNVLCHRFKANGQDEITFGQKEGVQG